MDFVHVADIARANLLAAQAEVTDDVFNIACGVETSLAELAGALIEAMEGKPDLEYGPARAVNGVTRRLADTAAAADRLNFVAEVDLRAGLTDLVAWWRAQRAAS
jgi:UDP-glucose 4-epimerase